MKYVFWLSEDAIVNIQQLFKDKIQLKLQMYLAHAHIEDRNRGPPLDFAGDFNVVTENASLNLWIVCSGLYLLCIYHLPICADICLYVFFDYLPIANIC